MKELSSIQALIDSFSKLQGIGIKSAEKLAYSVLSFSPEDRDEFAKALKNVSEKVHPCPICGLYTEGEKCEVCLDGDRDRKIVCVVSETKDALAIEKMKTFHGLYHVLGGVINASRGIGASNLRIEELIRRVVDEKIEEVILATNPTLDGETTALFIARLLEGKANVTRLGYGLPMGSSLDYADSVTLNKAFEGRKRI